MSKACHVCGDDTGYEGGSHPECRKWMAGWEPKAIIEDFSGATFTPGGYEKAVERVYRLAKLLITPTPTARLLLPDTEKL